MDGWDEQYQVRVHVLLLKNIFRFSILDSDRISNLPLGQFCESSSFPNPGLSSPPALAWQGKPYITILSTAMVFSGQKIPKCNLALLIYFTFDRFSFQSSSSSSEGTNSSFSSKIWKLLIQGRKNSQRIVWGVTIIDNSKLESKEKDFNIEPAPCCETWQLRAKVPAQSLGRADSKILDQV